MYIYIYIYIHTYTCLLISYMSHKTFPFFFFFLKEKKSCHPKKSQTPSSGSLTLVSLSKKTFLSLVSIFPVLLSNYRSLSLSFSLLIFSSQVSRSSPLIIYCCCYLLLLLIPFPLCLHLHRPKMATMALMSPAQAQEDQEERLAVAAVILKGRRRHGGEPITTCGRSLLLKLSPSKSPLRPLAPLVASPLRLL